MTVSAIIIRADDETQATWLRPLLEAEPRCTPGPARGSDLAAVLEFQTAGEGESLHGWLHSLPGVRAVDVVSTLHHHPGPLPHEGTPP